MRVTYHIGTAPGPKAEGGHTGWKVGGVWIYDKATLLKSHWLDCLESETFQQETYVDFGYPYELGDGIVYVCPLSIKYEQSLALAEVSGKVAVLKVSRRMAIKINTRTCMATFETASSPWVGMEFAPADGEVRHIPIRNQWIGEFAVDDEGGEWIGSESQTFWEMMVMEHASRLKIRMLVGAAGTGKTYQSVVASEKYIEAKKKSRVLACSFSGVGCENLSGAYRRMGYADVAESVKTPHSAFALVDSLGEWNGLPCWWSEGKRKVCKFMVIDEAFFWDARTLALVFSCLPSGTEVLMQGDPNQLAPVSGGEVAYAMMRSGRWPVETLTVDMRTSKDSDLVRLFKEDILRSENPDEVFKNIAPNVTVTTSLGQLLTESLKFMDSGYVAICPTVNLSRILGGLNSKSRWNKKTEIQKRGGDGSNFFSYGDEVIILTSNHAMGVRNGTRASYYSFHPDVKYPHHLVKLENGRTYRVFFREDHKPLNDLMAWADHLKAKMELNEEVDECKLEATYEEIGSESCRGLLCHAESITAHRAQGSEFEKVVVVVPWQCRVLSRDWLYVAATRAKKDVRVIFMDSDDSKVEDVITSICKKRKHKPSLIKQL